MIADPPTLHTHLPKKDTLADRFEELSSPRPPVRRGSACPNCRQGLLDYNGVLDLECPECGYVESGGGGCT